MYSRHTLMYSCRCCSSVRRRLLTNAVTVVPHGTPSMKPRLTAVTLRHSPTLRYWAPVTVTLNSPISLPALTSLPVGPQTAHCETAHHPPNLTQQTPHPCLYLSTYLSTYLSNYLYNYPYNYLRMCIVLV